MSTLIHQHSALALSKQFTGQGTSISVPAFLIRMTGDHAAAMVLSQCMFWSDTESDDFGWFEKTAADWQKCLYLTERQLSRCRVILERFGVDTQKRVVNNAPHLHWRINDGILEMRMLECLAEIQAEQAAEKAKKASHQTVKSPPKTISPNGEKAPTISPNGELQLTKTSVATHQNVKSILIENPDEILNTEIPTVAGCRRNEQVEGNGADLFELAGEDAPPPSSAPPPPHRTDERLRDESPCVTKYRRLYKARWGYDPTLDQRDRADLAFIAVNLEADFDSVLEAYVSADDQFLIDKGHKPQFLRSQLNGWRNRARGVQGRAPSYHSTHAGANGNSNGGGQKKYKAFGVEADEPITLQMLASRPLCPEVAALFPD